MTAAAAKEIYGFVINMTGRCIKMVSLAVTGEQLSWPGRAYPQISGPQNSAPGRSVAGVLARRDTDLPQDDRAKRGQVKIRCRSKVMFSQVNEQHRRFGRLAPEFTSTAWQIAAVGAATVVGLGVRLYRLEAAPLLSPEIYTWDFAHQTVPFIFGQLSHIETNPPFYYLLMKLVMQIGETEFFLRLPSVVAGTMAIPLVYVLGRLGGASKSGVIGAGLLSLSAIAITYSRQARTYALLQDVCLLAAIGTVIIINHYTGRDPQPLPPKRRELVGWTLFSLAAITGFYLHYTFAFEIFVLEFAIAAAIGMGWLGGKLRIDRALILKWLASSFVIVLAIAWGLVLARSQAQSDNIDWMRVPSLHEAIRLLIYVDGFSAVSRFQPLPNLLLIGLAAIGLVVGWKRSPAILVCGALFAMFPLVLFVVSQNRPVFIERSLVAPSFAVCLLAGYGTLFLVGKLSELGSEFFRRRAFGLGNAPFLSAIIASAAVVGLFGLAIISATNSANGNTVWEPYDKVVEYLASVMKPGDVAVGTDGVIYYRQQTKAGFPYFKLVEGDAAVARVTYGSPTARTEEVPKLAHAGHSVYLVLRQGIELVVHGHFYGSYAVYVLDKLQHRNPPIASFGKLGVYRLPGECTGSGPCLEAAQNESSPEAP
jgi:Dolichyl-phosphate-mannose-protein mannosyltransferase